MRSSNQSLRVLVAVATLSSFCAIALGEESRIRLAQAEARPTQARLISAIERIQAGSPNYDEMEPLLRAAVQNQFSSVQPRLSSLGKVQTVEFMGEQNGQDIYNVKFERGALAWGIQLSANGKILSLYFN